MTLCHELVHVRRHDLALGWVPALAERLFFFHPLARVAAREYLIAREAACDAAVLRALDVAPQEYGRLLLRFGVTRPEPGFSATGASSSTSSLRRRLDMLHHITLSRTSRRATWLLACIVALALLPFQLVARTPGEPAAVRDDGHNAWEYRWGRRGGRPSHCRRGRNARTGFASTSVGGGISVAE